MVSPLNLVQDSSGSSCFYQFFRLFLFFQCFCPCESLSHISWELRPFRVRIAESYGSHPASCCFLLQKSSVNSSGSLDTFSLTSCKLCRIRPPALVVLEMCGRISCTRDSRPDHIGHGGSYPPRLADYQVPSDVLAILPSAYPDPPGRRMFSILLPSILRIDGRMFSHSSSVPAFDYPGLTFQLFFSINPLVFVL